MTVLAIWPLLSFLSITCPGCTSDACNSRVCIAGRCIVNPINDNGPCTMGCMVSGYCLNGARVDSADSTCTFNPECDSVPSGCVADGGCHTTHLRGQSCDTNACQTGGMCDAFGQCNGSGVVICLPTGEDCHSNQCFADAGCMRVPNPGAACTFDAGCGQKGSCSVDGTSCVPQCNRQVSQCVGMNACGDCVYHDGQPCDAGQTCMASPTCSAGTCTYSQYNCPALDECHSVPGYCSFPNGPCGPSDSLTGAPCGNDAGTCDITGRCVLPDGGVVDAGIPSSDGGPTGQVVAVNPFACNCDAGSGTPLLVLGILGLRAIVRRRPVSKA